VLLLPAVGEGLAAGATAGDESAASNAERLTSNPERGIFNYKLMQILIRMMTNALYLLAKRIHAA
jgi:hypothetical protein